MRHSKLEDFVKGSSEFKVKLKFRLGRTLSSHVSTVRYINIQAVLEMWPRPLFECNK